MNTPNSITPFLFGESTIRTTVIENEPWFCAKDVCEFLALGNVSQAVNGNKSSGALGLDDDEKGITNLDTPSGIQKMMIVNEPGLYHLIFKSRKTEARAFRKWVTSEVLPNLRKKGYYGHREQGMLAFTRDLLAMGLDSKDATKITLAAFPPITRTEQKRAELEQANRQASQLPPLDEASSQLLALMEPGRPYQPGALLGKLPDTWANFTGQSPRARIIDVDNTLALLVLHGRITRLPGSQNAFALATDNVVAMTP